MVYLLAIASALLYGAADFTGGLTSRRAATIPVVIISQFSGLVSLLVALPLLPASSPSRMDLLWGAAAGLTGGVGVALLYRALAIGRMSVVAPTTAVCAVAIPVVVSFLLGERPVPLALAGIILGVVSIILVSQQTQQHSDQAEGGRRRPSGIGTAFVSGVAIGFFFLSIARTGPDAGMWPLIVARTVSGTMFIVFAIATKRSIRMPRDMVVLAVICGIVDMLANALYLLAARQGPLSIVVTLSSLYPASTVLLARIILGERLNLWQVSGVACALTAIILIVSGGRATAQEADPPPVDPAALQHLLTAEDARGTGPEGLAPLLAWRIRQDTLLRRLAVRGLGRLQRPELGRLLLTSLRDPVPAVRAEAANALAQSMRRIRRDTTYADTQFSVRQAAAALTQALAAERDAQVVDALGESLGRLPFPDSAAARGAEDAIRGRLTRQSTRGLVHGLYTLARARRATGNLDPSSIVALRSEAVGSPDTAVRRLALLTLAVADGLDSATAERASRDRDPEARRAMLRGTGALSPAYRAALARQAFSDSSRIVRIEAIMAARRGNPKPDCGPILVATKDRNAYVALTAIDSVGGGCADPGRAVATLRGLATESSTAGPIDHRWQVRAHALLALARLEPSAAAQLVPRFAASERWEIRQYAARAAATVGNTHALLLLAGDRDRNVQEAAIAGLSATVAHQADTVYLRALGSSGHQVVLAAASALKGTSHREAPNALLEAFDRLSASRNENARDPRMALLERIGETAFPVAAPRLRAYLADYDTTVAQTVATMLSKATGIVVEAHPTPLPIQPEPLAEVFLRRDTRLRVTMAPSSGGGSVTVQLFTDEVPATAARVLRLARQGFYDGKVFQRVEPNFVVQGGGPDANEYVGDSRFMRDELTLRTHARGTLGISTRGRDTGDGQWFINLVGNPLLDHEYTIFGRIVDGQEIAEQILEGDRIERVEVVPSSPATR